MNYLRLSAALAVCLGASAQTPQVATMPDVLQCGSEAGERKSCPAVTSAGVALLRSTGTGSCLLGKTWGYDDQGVWVSDGCSGEFALGSSKEGSTAGSLFVGLFEAYGQWRTHLATFQDDLEVQDNASRVGLNFATRGKIKMIAGTEWGVDIVQSANQFNLNASPAGDFGIDRTETPVFGARLGFIGTDFGPFGRVAIGKQNAVHYDIASYTTDRFNVFGGQGTFAYVGGTDGGYTGTGRADRVVQYRNNLFKVLDVGVQGQFRAAGNDSVGDGYGASLQAAILPGLKLGGSYTHTNHPIAVRERVRGLGGNADFVALGGRFDWRFLQLGAVWSHQHNGDLVFVPNPDPDLEFRIPVAFDAQGTEVYTRVGNEKFAVIGGFTQQLPDVQDSLLDPNFRTRYFILGGEWFVARGAKIYTESRIEIDSVTPTGGDSFGVFTIGFRYDFSWRTSHRP
jgi:predicted porin